MHKFLLTAFITFVIGTAQSIGQQPHRSLNGCDAGRWKEWALILDELEGWPIEQADAKLVRDKNRTICNAWLNGHLQESEADAAYQEVLDAWVRRMQERQRLRESHGRAMDSIG